MYPKLIVDLRKIEENATKVNDLCRQSMISVTGVVKGCNCDVKVVDAMKNGGISSFGSSRITQLKRVKSIDKGLETCLLRLPMTGEVQELVDYVDISLNSELKIIELINDAAEKVGKVHKVILMVDLGDLREGLWTDEELIACVKAVEMLSHVHLLGIGTNLGCYGSIKPTVKNMTELVQKAELVERAIGRSLEIISGGATTSLSLVIEGAMPGRINHLRVGEGILLARDLCEFFNLDFGLSMDAFTLQAEIVEIRDKPSYPVGEHFVDAFGNKPMFVDRGIRRRAILAVGKQDFGDHSKLICDETVGRVIGSSSDHLIVDVTESEQVYSVGDIMSFEMFYQPMLYLSISDDVVKDYKI